MKCLPTQNWVGDTCLRAGSMQGKAGSKEYLDMGALSSSKLKQLHS